MHAIQSTLSNIFESIATNCKLQTLCDKCYKHDQAMLYTPCVRLVMYSYLTHHLSSPRHASYFVCCFWIQLSFLKQRISHLQLYQHQPPLQCPWSQYQQKLPTGHQCQWQGAIAPHQVDPKRMLWIGGFWRCFFLIDWFSKWWTNKKQTRNPKKRRVKTCGGGMCKACKLSWTRDNTQECKRVIIFSDFREMGIISNYSR